MVSQVLLGDFLWSTRNAMPSKTETGFRLVVSGGDLAYLYFPRAETPMSGVAKRSINLTDSIESYSGPDILLDVDEDGHPIGLEILY